MTIRTAPSPIDFLPDLGRRTLIMGILNVTPDSFSDGGRFIARDAAIAHAHRLCDEGADLIDIGGESTRPGHTPVGEEEEIARVVPVISAIAAVVPPISIDTYKSGTARAALAAGARIINDIWGLQRDPVLADVAAEFHAPIVIMHNRETPDPDVDVIDDMRRVFERSIAIARRAGVPDYHIILDPGIGFGKTREQELDALRRVSELKALGYPVLIGASRKSFIGRISASHPGTSATSAATPRAPADRINGTLAAHVLAIGGGADILRAHDVAAHIEASRVADAILGTRTPAQASRS